MIPGTRLNIQNPNGRPGTEAHIETTPEHPFYTWERGWVDAGELRIGEHIHRANDGYGIVEALAVEAEPQVMYNLTVAER
jgi:hypothetical protein